MPLDDAWMDVEYLLSCSQLFGIKIQNILPSSRSTSARGWQIDNKLMKSSTGDQWQAKVIIDKTVIPKSLQNF